MKPALFAALLFALLAVDGNPVFADLPVLYIDYITRPVSEEVSLFILPDGSGDPLTEAYLYGGQSVDANITIRVVVEAGYPVPHYPKLDIWIGSAEGVESTCGLLFTADHDTDLNGNTEFTFPLPSGGWSEGPMWVYLNGWRAHSDSDTEHPPVAMRYNSADISGDGSVNLIDVNLFAVDFWGGYQYRSDFNWDGAVDLSDLAKLALGLGSICQ